MSRPFSFILPLYLPNPGKFLILGLTVIDDTKISRYATISVY